MYKYKWFLFLYSMIIINHLFCIKPTLSRKYEKQDLLLLREEVREMFEHAYSSYLKYAYPYDELRPLTCDGIDTWGSYSLTLIDALDTLAVMGNYTEFQRVIDIVSAKANFDANINVSVFETNIRIVGGLLSAHLLSQKAGVEVEPGWPCNGPLLRLAEDVAQRLLAAFDTFTGMPFGTVNLRHGVPPGETPVTCTAGVGTFILEFGTLSRLTGDPVYEEVALNALNSLYQHRSPIGLFGNHIDVMTGRWTAQDSGIGAGVDSYFEYLVKGSILLQRPELMAMFNHIRQPIDKYLKKNNWYVWASMHKGLVTLPVFQSLEAYWPGVLTLIGDIENALRSMHNYNSIWKQYGFTPEFYNIAQGEAGTNRESYPLRPELAESAMYLYRATGDPFMLDIGVNILKSIQHSAKTPCGYATIKDARDHTQENRMESFFLAETTKYLYLLFDPDNFIHNKGQHGYVHTLSSGRQCVLDSGGYIFNTEAHPIDPGALQCCYDRHTEETNNHFNAHDFKGEALKPRAKPKLKPVERKKLKEPIEEETLEVELPSALADPEAGIVLPPEGNAILEELKKEVKLEEKIVTTAPVRPKTEDTEFKIKLKSDLADERAVKREETAKKGAPQRCESRRNSILDIIKRDSKKEKADVIKENEPTFHQDCSGLTTENTSKEPVIAEGDWSSENLSFQAEDETVTVGLNTEPNRHETGARTLPEFVEQLVSITPIKKHFDPQELLERIRLTKNYKTNGWNTRYELLTCKAQPFSIRITIAGEFIDAK